MSLNLQHPHQPHYCVCSHKPRFMQCMWCRLTTIPQCSYTSLNRVSTNRTKPIFRRFPEDILVKSSRFWWCCLRATLLIEHVWWAPTNAHHCAIQPTRITQPAHHCGLDVNHRGRWTQRFQIANSHFSCSGDMTVDIKIGNLSSDHALFRHYLSSLSF